MHSPFLNLSLVFFSHMARVHTRDNRGNTFLCRHLMFLLKVGKGEKKVVGVLLPLMFISDANCSKLYL